MSLKVCIECKEAKEANEDNFTKGPMSSKGKQYYASRCKECNAPHLRRIYLENKEKLKELYKIRKYKKLEEKYNEATRLLSSPPSVSSSSAVPLASH
jgi:hypothetical protein